MNQADTGRFIANCRKEKGLTQAQLAEKLNITDRAISKCCLLYTSPLCGEWGAKGCGGNPQNSDRFGYRRILCLNLSFQK